MFHFCDVWCWWFFSAPRMSGYSEHRELDRISMEMNQLSFRRQQLIDRRNMLTILQEFRNRSNRNSTGKEEIHCLEPLLLSKCSWQAWMYCVMCPLAMTQQGWCVLSLTPSKTCITSLCTAEGSKQQTEIQCLDKELQELSEKKRALQESQDNILHSKDHRKGVSTLPPLWWYCPHTALS